MIVSYASANRDERHYPEPNRFDIERNPVDHLGFGLATHNCAGQALAKLEGWPHSQRWPATSTTSR